MRIRTLIFGFLLLGSWIFLRHQAISRDESERRCTDLRRSIDDLRTRRAARQKQIGTVQTQLARVRTAEIPNAVGPNSPVEPSASPASEFPEVVIDGDMKMGLAVLKLMGKKPLLEFIRKTMPAGSENVGAEYRDWMKEKLTPEEKEKFLQILSKSSSQEFDLTMKVFEEGLKSDLVSLSALASAAIKIDKERDSALGDLLGAERLQSMQEVKKDQQVKETLHQLGAKLEEEGCPLSQEQMSDFRSRAISGMQKAEPSSLNDYLELFRAYSKPAFLEWGRSDFKKKRAAWHGAAEGVLSEEQLGHLDAFLMARLKREQPSWHMMDEVIRIFRAE